MVKFSDGWMDIYKDGLRLEQAIKRVNKKLKKCDDVDKLIKLSNSLVYLTDSKIRIIDMALGVKQLIRTAEKNNPGSYEKRFSRENIESAQNQE